MTPQSTPYDQESTMDIDLADCSLQAESSALPLRCLDSLYDEASESIQPARGEPCGVGSQSCDQETRAWNPRYCSMNYALTRLTRAG